MKHKMIIRVLFSLALFSCIISLKAEETGIATGTVHYQPADSVFGDPIPYYHKGVHHVFYLKKGSWYHLISRDLVTWEDIGPALTPDANDRSIATGSIIEKDGTFQAFYTTADRKGQWNASPNVRVATSKDLKTWTKVQGEPLLVLKRDVPQVGTFNSVANWRDPHVFWNPKAKEWWMAIAASEKTSLKYPYAGAVALVTSKDLRKWTVQKKPLLKTREIVASECPDVFPFGDGWAMVYYTDTTRIRLADDPAGPWRRPENDAPWGLHFQAGKTEFDGKRRIIHAYLQRSEGDYSKHVYGGCMALPRELYLDGKNRVAVRLVPEIVAACKKDVTGGKGGSIFTAEKVDSVKLSREEITLGARTGDTALALWKDAPADLFLAADVTMEKGANLSLLIRCNTTARHPGRSQSSPFDDSYALTLDGHMGRMTLYHNGSWNRMPPMRCRKVEFPVDRSFKLYLMLHGDVVEAFVDDRVSLCARVQLPAGGLGLMARDGKVSLKNLKITKLP